MRPTPVSSYPLLSSPKYNLKLSLSWEREGYGVPNNNLEFSLKLAKAKSRAVVELEAKYYFYRYTHEGEVHYDGAEIGITHWNFQRSEYFLSPSEEELHERVSEPLIYALQDAFDMNALKATLFAAEMSEVTEKLHAPAHAYFLERREGHDARAAKAAKKALLKVAINMRAELQRSP